MKFRCSMEVVQVEHVEIEPCYLCLIIRRGGWENENTRFDGLHIKVSNSLTFRSPSSASSLGLLIKSSTTGAAAAADDGSDTVASGGGGDEVNDVLCLQSYSILIASHGRRLGATKRSCCCCCQINREDANDGDDDNRKQASKINQRTLTAAADDGGGVRTRPCEYCAGMLTICDRKLRLYLERLLLRTPR